MNTSSAVINPKKIKLQQKYQQKSKIVKKMNLAFFLRFFSLLIFIISIIVSGIISSNYINDNSKLNIDFAGGYQVQVMYTGDATNQNDIISMLEGRVDPMGSSNVTIENVIANNKNNLYNVALSKNAGISMLSFVHSVVRSGYFYILDSNGNDLLATKKDEKSKSWTKREKRLRASDIFDKITAQNDINSHNPAINFSIKPTGASVLSDIKADTNPQNKYYIYSDIGQLLAYIRSTIDGIISLANIVDEITDVKIKRQLASLLENNTPGLGSKGEDVLQSAKNQDLVLKNLLDINKNGQSGINWKYSDLANASYRLSVDINDEKNVYDPANRFDDPTANGASPMNAWLPYIKELIHLPFINNTSIINSQYAPYWIGEINNPTDKNIIIQDETLNFEKTKQIQNLLTAGLSKNNFTLISSQFVSPTLGANAIKIIIGVLVIAIIILITIVLFYYRLLGFIVLIVISFFLIFCLTTFTVINGIIGPETVIALIICFALLIDTIINLLERFKNEVKDGKTLVTAFKVANKKTLVSGLDCNVITMIVSLIIFWFGTRAIKGFAMITSIATFGVIIFGIIILRLILWAMVHNNWLENKPQWLGTNISLNSANAEDINNTISPSKINKNHNVLLLYSKIISKFKPKQPKSFHQLSKWVIISSFVILIFSGITYAVAGANFGTGFDTRKDFIGLASIVKAPSQPDYNINQTVNDAINKIKKQVNNDSQFYKYLKDIKWAEIAGGIGNQYQFKIIIEVINSSSLNTTDFNAYLTTITNNWDIKSSVSWGEINAVTAKSGSRLLINMIITIALSFIIILIYIVVRFQLTYIMPLILAIIFGLIMTMAIISMLQIPISTSIVGVLLGVMILIILSNMIIFDNINEAKINNMKTKILTTSEITTISNQSIKKSLARTLFINMVVVFLTLMVIFIIPSFWAVSLAMMVGCMVSLITSYFISPWLWTYFEKWRVARYKKNLSKIKKHFIGADEYIIEGINE